MTETNNIVSKSDNGAIWVSDSDWTLIYKNGKWTHDVPTADDLKDNYTAIQDGSPEALEWLKKAQAEIEQNPDILKEPFPD